MQMRRALAVFSLILATILALATAANSGTATRTQEDAARSAELGRRAIRLLTKGNLQAAEDLLHELLELQPDHPRHLYNLACVQAQQGDSDEAVASLARALEQGFTNFAHLSRDPDLKSLHQRPDFKALLSRQAEFQRRTADRFLAQLREQLGTEYLYEISEADKLIFATNTDAATLQALRADLTLQAHSQWEQIFDQKPQQYIAVVLPSPEDYRRLVPDVRMRGVYKAGRRMLVASQLGQVMTHEFTHALHHADLDVTRARLPVWVMEGMASLYEARQFAGGRLVPSDNFRLTEVQAAARDDRLIPLDKLLEMNQRQFTAQSRLAYGQASSLLLYLHEQGRLKSFHDAAKAGAKADPTCRNALVKIVGKSLDKLESDWRRWMLRRKAPPRTTGPDGAFLGVQFGEANDGLRVEQVVPGSAAARAAIRIGDVIVGIGTLEIRDYLSLIPALAQYRPGDSITVRLRRDGEYVEVPILLGIRPE